MNQNSLKKNFLYNIFYQVLVIVVPLITSPYLTRTVGAEGLGIYSYIQAYAHYFVLFVMLGLNNYGNREIAKARNQKYEVSRIFWEIYSFQLFSLLVVSVIYISFIIVSVNENRLIYWIQYLYVLSAGFDINWCCFGLEKFKLTVTRNSIIKIASAVLIFVFVKNEHDLWVYTFIIASTTLISQIVVWPFVLKEIRFVKPTIKGIVTRIKPNLLLFLPVIAISLYTIMDKIMLGFIDTKEEVAYYSYAERIIQIPLSFITALGTVMLPRTSNMISKGKTRESMKLMEKSMQFSLFMSIGSTAGVMAVSNILIPWYYGSNFSKCSLFTIALAPVIAFTSWNTVIRTQYVIPKGLDKIYLATVTSGAVANVSLNMLLIKDYRGIGAIFATIIAQFLVCFIQYLLLRKQLNYSVFFKDTICFLLCGIIMGVIVYFLPAFGEHVLASIVFKMFSGIVIYLALSFVYLKYIKRDLWLINSVTSIICKKRKQA